MTASWKEIYSTKCSNNDNCFVTIHSSIRHSQIGPTNGARGKFHKLLESEAKRHFSFQILKQYWISTRTLLFSEIWWRYCLLTGMHCSRRMQISPKGWKLPSVSPLRSPLRVLRRPECAVYYMFKAVLSSHSCSETQEVFYTKWTEKERMRCLHHKGWIRFNPEDGGTQLKILWRTTSGLRTMSLWNHGLRHSRSKV
jgi:hypothetical protein